MTDREIILDFYLRSFEFKINENMLEYDYVFPEKRVVEYIDHVTSVPIDEILDVSYIMRNDLEIVSADFLQFSSLEDATDTICDCYIEQKNPGLDAEETGRLILRNEKAKRLLTYRKYGENHAKCAEALGLVYSITNVFFLSCIGEVYTSLNQEQKEMLLTRMVLRTREIEQLYRHYRNGVNISARKYMSILSESTYKRRRSNLKRLLRVLRESKEYDFSPFLDAIIIE